MLRASLIAMLLLILFPACRNAAGGNKKLSAPANTAYLKNTSLSIDESLLKESPKAVHEFYANKGMATVWTEQGSRKALIAAIKDAGSDGLQPEDYNLAILQQFEALTSITREECARYDIMLSESFTTLATHLFKGKLKPSKVYYDWALAPKKIDTEKLLAEAIEKGNVKEVLDRCRPKHPVYAGLRRSLQYLNSLEDDSALPAIVVEQPVKLKDSGAVVATIRQRLVYWGDLDKDKASGNVYDRASAKAVKRFQKRHGLYPDGKVDEKVAELLNIHRDDRRKQVIANLERWRWFPYDFGKRAIIVNIPTFELAVVENNKDTIDTYKVIVGKPDRRSPVLYSSISQLVVNPTWTIPPTYLLKDLTPAAIKDTAHFRHLNIKIFYKNEEIPVTEWDSLKPDHYVYVQSPGDHNSLGRIKFNFRNGFFVYLHDTNHREYFRKGYRALSSGCIRVEDPFRLAEYILKEDKEWNREKLDELVAAGETEQVGLKKTTLIHQLYWTAWMDKDGIQFRNDIYNLDTILYDKLRK